MPLANNVTVTVRMPEWVIREVETLPDDFTGRVELNFHLGKIGSVNVTKRVTED